MYTQKERLQSSIEATKKIWYGRYRVVLNQSIREPSNDFVKYYNCVDELTDSGEYFAIESLILLICTTK